MTADVRTELRGQVLRATVTPRPGDEQQRHEFVSLITAEGKFHFEDVAVVAAYGRRYRLNFTLPTLNIPVCNAVEAEVFEAARSPEGGGGGGLFAQQEREPIRGRPTVSGKRTYGGRPGQRVEEQGTWASRAQKHSEAGYGRPVDGGVWTAKTVK